MAALVGGGARAAILLLALRRGEAHPPGRARLAMIGFGLIALLGAVGLLPLYAPW